MRVFVTGGLCVSVEEIDFLDPGHLDYGRERGVRLELRMVGRDTGPGSIYVSRGRYVERAVCRFDLLESAPHAQDRMHWHPRMSGGEPGQRVFDPDLRTDPLAFVGARLRDAVALLKSSGVEDCDSYTADAEELAQSADAIVADTAASLARIRDHGWSDVLERDDRGMAVAWAD